MYGESVLCQIGEDSSPPSPKMKMKTTFPAFRELGQVGERGRGYGGREVVKGISKNSSDLGETIASKRGGGRQFGNV